MVKRKIDSPARVCLIHIDRKRVLYTVWWNQRIELPHILAYHTAISILWPISFRFIWSVWVARWMSVYMWRGFRSCMSFFCIFQTDFETIEELANWVCGHKATQETIYLTNNLWKWNMQIHSKRSCNIVDVVLNMW